MAVTLYQYTDASAPSLTGQVGSMIALLDAVLVNGYGSKPGAGWTKEYSGTNLAAYRNDPLVPGSTGMYLRVDDTNATYASCVAYKTMSDINTGTDAAPSGTPAYTNPASYWVKSSASSSAVRPWAIIADERTFYYQIGTDATTEAGSNYTLLGGAGDFVSYVPGNTYNYFVAGSQGTTYTSMSYQLPIAPSGTDRGAFMGRSQELVANKCSDMWVAYIANQPSGSQNQMAYSAYTGQRLFYPAYVHETATQTNITGHLRGVYGYAGRTTGNWLEDFGTLPDNPTGPSLLQFFQKQSTTYQSALYILQDGW